jgi:hypothetical protein
LPSEAKMAREPHTGQASRLLGMKKGKARWTFPFFHVF